jgi:hypothetical protein
MVNLCWKLSKSCTDKQGTECNSTAAGKETNKAKEGVLQKEETKKASSN